MADYKCKMCGGTLEMTDIRSGIGVCEYCGTKQTVSKTRSENLKSLFNRANYLRLKNEFDKAEQFYERIIQEDDEDAEAYWGLILCRYGIEYVEDPHTLKRVPTCHRTSFESIVADGDYKNVLKYADNKQKAIYESEAKEIDRIQKDILSLSEKEKPYDVFICYKEKDENGKRTQDSVIANDIYYQLTQEGFKVFYAAITLEDKLGSEYEPYIFAALNSAKVMLVVGTRPDYFNAVWVKNEWSRYLKIMKKDRSKMLVPCYRDIDAYELPEEFAHLQAQDMSKLGFIPDLVRNIKKIISGTDQKTGHSTSTVSNHDGGVERLIKNGQTYMKLNNYEEAEEVYRRATKEYPEDYRGWWGLILCKTQSLNINKQRMRITDLSGIKTWFGYVKQLADETAYTNIEKEFVRYLEKDAYISAEKDIEDIDKKITSLKKDIVNCEDTINILKTKQIKKNKDIDIQDKEDDRKIEERMKDINKVKRQRLTYGVFGAISIVAMLVGFITWINSGGDIAIATAGGFFAIVFLIVGFVCVTYALDASAEKACVANVERAKEMKVLSHQKGLSELSTLRKTMLQSEEEIVNINKKIDDCNKYKALGKEKIAQYWLCKECDIYGIVKKVNPMTELLRDNALKN